MLDLILDLFLLFSLSAKTFRAICALETHSGSPWKLKIITEIVESFAMFAQEAFNERPASDRSVPFVKVERASLN